MKKMVGVLIALISLVIGGGGLHMLIDQQAVRQHVVQALREQTGLDLHMERAEFQILPWPSFHAEAIALMRPGCSPFMTAQAVHADISLLALFHREISFQDFTAEGAWVSFYRPALDRDDVCSSWLPFPLQKASSGLFPSGAGTAGQRIPARWKISFDALHLSDAHILWQDDDSSMAGAVDVSSLDFAGLRSDSPWVDVQARYAHVPFALKGHVGHLSSLFRTAHAGERPWLFSVGLSIGEGSTGENLTFDGSIVEPHRLRGVRLSVQGQWPNLEKNQGIGQWLFPSVPWLSVSGLRGVVNLQDDFPENVKEVSPPVSGNRRQFVEALKSLSARLYPVMLHVKADSVTFSDKGVGSIHLSSGLIDAAGPDLPLMVQGMVSWGRYTWYGRAHLGPLKAVVAGWRDSGHSPVPLDLSLQGRGLPVLSLFEGLGSSDAAVQELASLHLSGLMTKEKGDFMLEGAAQKIDVPFWVPRNSQGSQLHHVTLKTALHVMFPQRSLSLSGGVLESDEIAVRGDGDIAYNTATHMHGQFRVEHADMDTLLGNVVANGVSGEAVQRTPSQTGKPRRLILQLQQIFQQWGWDMRVTGKNIHYAGMCYEDMVLTSSLAGGILQSKVTGSWHPVSALSDLAHDPTMGASVSIMSAGKDGLRLSVASDGPGEGLFFPAYWLAYGLGWPDYVHAVVQIVGAVSAQGKDVQSLKRSVTGKLGIAVVDGTIDSALLVPLAGPATSLLKLGTGTETLRCMAGSLSFQQGQVHAEDLALQAGHFLVTGSGTSDVPEGVMALQLYPHVSLAGNVFTVPVRVQGPFLQPDIIPVLDINNTHPLMPGSETTDATRERDDPCFVPLQKARGDHPGLALPALSTESRAGQLLHALGLGGK